MTYWKKENWALFFLCILLKEHVQDGLDSTLRYVKHRDVIKNIRNSWKRHGLIGSFVTLVIVWDSEAQKRASFLLKNFLIAISVSGKKGGAEVWHHKIHGK